MTQIAIFAMFNVNNMITNRLKGFHDIKGTISTVILLNLSFKKPKQTKTTAWSLSLGYRAGCNVSPCQLVHGRIQKGDRGPDPPLKIHKDIGFLSNTCPDPLINHKATKPVLNVGPSSASQRNTI